MIFDLENEKIMDRAQSLRVMSDNSHHRASRGLRECVRNRAVFRLHYRHSGRDRVVNKHGNVEVVSGEHRCNMSEMQPDLIASSSISLVVGVDFDDPAVSQQFKMMFCILVRESHCVITARIDAGRVLISGASVHWTIHFFLRVEGHRAKCEARWQKYFHGQFLS